MSQDLLAHLPQLLSIATIGIFMAMSPGADFVMITRNSICHGRSAGVFSALGVAMAIWIHVAYSIAGLAVIISRSIVLFSVLKFVGAAYLIYIGWKTFRTGGDVSVDTTVGHANITGFAALRMGFISNALNPKTTIFFLSLFTQVISPDTSLSIQFVYGAIISLAHFVWFVAVASFLGQPAMLRRFNHWKRHIEKAVGCLLMLLGLKVAAMSSN